MLSTVSRVLRLGVQPVSSVFSRGIASSGLIDYHELREKIAAAPKDFVLVDVREPHEFQAGAIPQAKNVPCMLF